MALARQIARFATVGSLATLLHVAVALICNLRLDLSPHAANGAGFAAAVLLSYFGQGRWAFRVALRHRMHAPRFLAVALAGLSVSSTVTQITVVWLGAPFWLAMGAVACAVPFATFLLCKFWVFAPGQRRGA